MPQVDPMIQAQGLAKRFGKVDALVDVSFTVQAGELFGFLGPNGAGKTTTINVLTGLARADRGSVRVAGIDCSCNPKAAQHLMGVVPDESNLYPELTGYQNLCFCGALYGLRKRERQDRARQLLERVGLTEAADRGFGGYSKGMKRRLTIAAGLIHAPPLLFLDEPTSGIDVASARQLRQLIADLNAAGTTVFLTTHYLEEAERLCSRVAFVVAGRVVRTEAMADLLRQVQGRHVVEVTVAGGAERLCPRLVELPERLQCEALDDRRLRVEAREPVRVGPLVRFLEEQGGQVEEARQVRPSLEEVFVQITGIEASALRQERERPRPGGGS